METVGSLVDKLSINELKIYHMEKETKRLDVDAEFLTDTENRLAILKSQRDALKDELTEILDECARGGGRKA